MKPSGLVLKVIDGEPYQVVAENVAWNLDVRELDGEAAEKELREMASQPFSLEQAPLMRAHLWIHPQNKYTLLINIHHIITDGWSQGVIERELALAYTQYAAGLEASLPPPDLDYIDYAVWQRSWLQGEEVERVAGLLEGKPGGCTRIIGTANRPSPAASPVLSRASGLSGNAARPGRKITRT